MWSPCNEWSLDENQMIIFMPNIFTMGKLRFISSFTMSSQYFLIIITSYELSYRKEWYQIRNSQNLCERTNCIAFGFPSHSPMIKWALSSEVARALRKPSKEATVGDFSYKGAPQHTECCTCIFYILILKLFIWRIDRQLVEQIGNPRKHIHF